MGARVKVHDPIAMRVCREQFPDLRVTYCDTPERAADNADALVLVTEWEEYGKLDLERIGSRMARRILVDGRNLFDPETARLAGFDYTGIGRCASAAVPAALVS
jgi:UDPglucose 6-dehydrogenase